MVKLSTRCARVLSMFGVFALGVAVPTLGKLSDATAQSSRASVLVPEEGLTFRTPDGRILARLSSGPSGGVLEMYDAHERPSSAMRALATSNGNAIPRNYAAWSPRETEEDLIDPWHGVSPGRVPPPSGL